MSDPRLHHTETDCTALAEAFQTHPEALERLIEQAYTLQQQSGYSHYRLQQTQWLYPPERWQLEGRHEKIRSTLAQMEHQVKPLTAAQQAQWIAWWLRCHAPSEKGYWLTTQEDLAGVHLLLAYRNRPPETYRIRIPRGLPLSESVQQVVHALKIPWYPHRIRRSDQSDRQAARNRLLLQPKREPHHPSLAHEQRFHFLTAVQWHWDQHRAPISKWDPP